jgi:large subunit ribosomal protein L31e
VLREVLAEHFSVDEDDVRVDPSLNEALWAQGRQSPPSKLRVRAARFDEDGEVTVEAEPAE